MPHADSGCRNPEGGLAEDPGYRIDAEGSATVSFDVQGLKEGVYINKVVAAGNGYSDGEQHYLPVLGNRELVVNTLPITLHQQASRVST